jgi:multiple sugar transport system ATP-binding protein
MRTEISKLHNRLGTTTIYVTHDQTEAMTMADRIVVLKDGEVQQVASPQEMYERPVNVFVAGFIGSPAMNFIRAHVESGGEGSTRYEAVFGGGKEGAKQTRIPISKEALSEHPEIGDYDGREVILGVRPEHMQDASIASIPSLANEAEDQSTLDIQPEVIESMGSEKYVYFSPGREQVAHSKTLDEMTDISEDGGGDGAGGAWEESEDGSSEAAGGFGDMMVARVSAESEATKGGSLRLRIEAGKVRLFDPETERAIG